MKTESLEHLFSAGTKLAHLEGQDTITYGKGKKKNPIPKKAIKKLGKKK